MTERRHSLYYQRRAFNRVKTMRPPGDYLLRMYAETTGEKLAFQLGVCRWTLYAWLREARKS